MKAFGTLGTAFLFLSLGTLVPAFAQQGQEEAKPEEKPQHAQQQNQDKNKEQNKQQQEKNKQPPATAQQPQQQPQSKPPEPQQASQQKQDSQQPQKAQQQDQNKQPAATAQQAQPQNQNKQPQQQEAQRQNVQQPVHHTQEEQRAQQAAWQEHRSENWDSDHRTWQQRGGYIGYRIPDDRFRVNFGPEHRFVIYSQPFMVVGGFPRFQYGGFWFNLVDPWPSAWAQNWYETDDVYVVYANQGYYMYNRRYPTIGLAINVSL